MSRRTENEKEFKSVSYWRILRFVRPYWLMLTIGILAGLTVGGSMFGGLMLLPDMAMIVDQDPAQSEKNKKTAEEVIRAVEEAPAGMTEEEKTQMVTEIMHPVDTDPKLTKSLDKLRDYKQTLHLPIEVGKRSVTVQWPVEFEFPIVDQSGRMTWQFFMVYAVLFILAWILKNLATYINHYNMRWVSVRVIADMRNLLYERLLSQSMKFFGHQDVGHLISRCTNDTAMIEHSIADVIADITRCPLEIIACLCAMIIASVQQRMFTMLIIIVVGMPLCVIPVMVLGRKIRRIYKGAFAQVAELVSRMHETFSGILLIKSNHTETREARKFVLVNGKYFRTVVKALRLKLFLLHVKHIGHGLQSIEGDPDGNSKGRHPQLQMQTKMPEERIQILRKERCVFQGKKDAEADHSGNYDPPAHPPGISSPDPLARAALGLLQLSAACIQQMLQAKADKPYAQAYRHVPDHKRSAQIPEKAVACGQKKISSRSLRQDLVSQEYGGKEYQQVFNGTITQHESAHSSIRRVISAHIASAELKFSGTISTAGIVMSNSSSSSEISASTVRESRR